jgi:macrocin-O-methyltransferase TylF-like protien
MTARMVRRSPRLLRLAGLVNDVLISTLGVRLVSGREGIGTEWVERLLYFERLLQRVEHVPGDIVECGVAQGESLGMLSALNRQQRSIWGFDSWEGLPEIRPGAFADATPKTVSATLRWFGVDGSGVRLIKGWFSDTLPQYAGRIALLHIDADLYEGYRDALTLWDRVMPDGIVALDEYQQEDLWPGAKRAVDEFLTQTPAQLERDARYGRYYLIRPAGPDAGKGPAGGQ